MRLVYAKGPVVLVTMPTLGPFFCFMGVLACFGKDLASFASITQSPGIGLLTFLVSFLSFSFSFHKSSTPEPITFGGKKGFTFFEVYILGPNMNKKDMIFLDA